MPEITRLHASTGDSLVILISSGRALPIQLFCIEMKRQQEAEVETCCYMHAVMDRIVLRKIRLKSGQSSGNTSFHYKWTWLISPWRQAEFGCLNS